MNDPGLFGPPDILHPNQAGYDHLGAAWVKSTKGSGATPARVSFATAARNIANKIG